MSVPEAAIGQCKRQCPRPNLAIYRHVTRSDAESAFGEPLQPTTERVSRTLADPTVLLHHLNEFPQPHPVMALTRMGTSGAEPDPTKDRYAGASASHDRHRTYDYMDISWAAIGRASAGDGETRRHFPVARIITVPYDYSLGLGQASASTELDPIANSRAGAAAAGGHHRSYGYMNESEVTTAP